MSENVMLIRWHARAMHSIPDDVASPRAEDGWRIFKFNPALGAMVIKDVPFQLAGLKERVHVMVDMGSPGGLNLDEGLWSRIQAELPGRRCSLMNSWNPLSGPQVERAYIFDEVQLFGTPLKNVSVGR